MAAVAIIMMAGGGKHTDTVTTTTPTDWTEVLFLFVGCVIMVIILTYLGREK